MLSHLVSKLFKETLQLAITRRRLARRRTPGYRLQLEDLEGRMLLSAWARPESGDWDEPSNWSDGRVPGGSDDVSIPFQGITVTHATSADDAARSLSSEAAIDLSAGSLTIQPSDSTASSTINDLFTVSGGTLSVANTTLDGRGTLRNFGTVIFGINQSTGGDTINVAVDNEGLLTSISTAINNDADRPFTNGPKATLRVQGMSSFSNAFTNPGRFEVQADLAFAKGTLVNAPGASLDLYGRLHVSLDNQGTITSQFGLIEGNTVTNEGTIDLADFAGMAVTHSAFSNSGTITLGDRARFTVVGGTYENDGSIAGPGTLALDGITATLTQDQANAVAALEFADATITSPAILTNITRIHDSTINATVIVRHSMTFSGHTGLEGHTIIDGGLAVDAGVTLEIVGETDAPASLAVTHSLDNHGSIVLTGGDSLRPAVAELSVTGTLSNGFGATITMSIGTHRIGGPRFLNARLANGGTINIDSETTLTGSVENFGAINVQGANLRVHLTGSGTTFNNVIGPITVASGRSLAVDGGDFVTGGRVMLSRGGSFLVDGSYSQRNNGGLGARTDLNGGVLTVGGLMDIRAGKLAGPGVINGNVNMGDFAELDVGGDGFPGVLTINGDYTQSNLATMVIRIANTTPGLGYDQLNISGQATLDGTLRVVLVAGFDPRSGDSFTILTFGSRTGTMDVTGDGPRFIANFDDNDVILVAI
jgi:hypothetical protein